MNKLVGGNYLQFTCEVWLDNIVRPAPEISPEEAKKNKVAIQNDKTFPYLDMELHWLTKGELQFQVHLKPNQQLKYLNEGSVHAKACIKAIPEGVYRRLAKLTTVTEENQDKTLDEIHPMHFKALSHAGLITAKTKQIPTLTEELLNYKASKSDKDKIKVKKEDEKKRRRATFFCIAEKPLQAVHEEETFHANRTKRELRAQYADDTTYFCIGKSSAFRTPIYKTIQKLKEKHNLPWIRVAMSYHCFTKLKERFSGDIVSKLNEGVPSFGFDNLECNCQSRNCWLN